MSTADWCQHSAVAVQRRTGTLPTPSTARDFREQLRRCHRLLTAAYDTRPWWAREVWDPNLDPRIPQRPHEPRGRQAAHFTRIGIGWLHRGLQWYCKVALETGALSWGTVQQRVSAIGVFDAFLHDRAVSGPWLADDPAQVRALMLDYLDHLRGRWVERPGRGQGQPLSRSLVSSHLAGVEQFYVFMHDHRDTAAATNLAAVEASTNGRSSTPTRSPRSWPASASWAPPAPRTGSVMSRRCASSCCWPAPAGASMRSACSTATRCCRWTLPPRALSPTLVRSLPGCTTNRPRSKEPPTPS